MLINDCLFTGSRTKKKYFIATSNLKSLSLSSGMDGQWKAIIAIGVIVTHLRDRLIMRQYPPQFIGQTVNRQHGPVSCSFYFFYFFWCWQGQTRLLNPYSARCFWDKFLVRMLTRKGKIFTLRGRDILSFQTHLLNFGPPAKDSVFEVKSFKNVNLVRYEEEIHPW